MKKRSILLMTLLLAGMMALGQEISGQWNGVLKIQGMQLRLVFHIQETDEGLIGTMDSPDQGATGIAITSLQYEDGELEIQIAPLLLAYKGELRENGLIEGEFSQAGQRFPMTLSRKEVQPAKIVRPQDPVEPYPYHAEDVFFNNEQAGIRLAGTLTLPTREGRYPAVILISGSGPQNRDEEIMGHKPFLILSDYLTRQGIAVLRFDDRGTAESEGDFAAATTADFATDVASALAYLKTREEIDHQRMGLIGHSEGGIIAPMVASQSDDVAFIVLLAGTGIRGDQLLLQQQRLVGQAYGASEEALEDSQKLNRAVFDLVLESPDVPTLEAKLRTYFDQLLVDHLETPPEGLSEEEFIAQQIQSIANPWMHFFLRHDPAPVLEQVRCPVLAINGGNDLQVPAKVNLAAIEQALKKGGNSDVTVLELPGLNHLMQESETGSPAEYASIEQTFSPIALSAVGNWIKQILPSIR